MTPAIRALTTIGATQLEDLSELLQDCVEGGASVGFVQPFSRDQARAFWRGAAQALQRGERALLVAEDEAQRIVGSVQLLLAQPANQPHRADVSKLLVHRRARQQGLPKRWCAFPWPCPP